MKSAPYDTMVMLEYEDEAGMFLEERSPDGDSLDRTLIVALSARAQLYLKKRGIAYENTLPYFDNAAHARVLEKTEEMLRVMESGCTLPAALRADLTFHIRILLSYLVWLAEILDSVHSRHPGIMTIRVPSSRLPANDTSGFPTPDERYLGGLAEEFAQQRRMRFEEIVVRPETPPVQLHKRTPIIRDIFRRLSTKVLVGLLRMLPRHSPNALLVTSAYHLDQAALAVTHDVPDLSWLEILPGDVSPRTMLRNLSAVLSKLILRSHRPVQLFMIPLAAFGTRSSGAAEAAEIEGALADLAHRVAGDWRDTFSHNGLGVGHHVSRKLLTGCCTSLQEAAALRPALRALLNKFDIKLVLAPYSLGLSNIVGDTCRELGIPSIMITHGTHAAPRNRAEEIEWYRMSLGTILSPSYEYTVAQTPWARHHADYYKVGDRTLNTEPLLFAKVSQADRESMRRKVLNGADQTDVVVYAVTHKPPYSPRFYIYQTEDEVLTSMTDLVRAVNEMEGTRLVIKSHPGYPYTESELRSLLPESDRITVLQREPFSEVLSIADMLVSYSSTTIDEAVYHRVPVLLYDRWSRYSHLDAYDCDAEEACEPAAVYYTTSPERLSTILSHILRNRAIAREDDTLYARLSFGPGEYQPFAGHVKRILALERAMGARPQ